MQKGDTLYAIALSNGIGQKDLAAWNNIQDAEGYSYWSATLFIVALPSDAASPFSLPEATLPSRAIAAPGTLPPSETKPLVNTDKLKNQPKAFKLPYSELAIAQLKGLADSSRAIIPA